MYAKTKDITDSRVPIKERTRLPHYVPDKIGHHISDSSLHFYNHIGPREPGAQYTRGIHGGHHGTETRQRQQLTYQSSIFTKHNYDKFAGNDRQDRDLPIDPQHVPHPQSHRRTQAKTPDAAYHRDMERKYNENDRGLKEMIRTNGRADHVERVIKANGPATRYVDENTTYKTKFGVDGFQRHSPMKPHRERDTTGKISSTHWNAHDY